VKSEKCIIAPSERDADLYYACGFLAPDPFAFVTKHGKRIIILNDLELDRGRAEARVDEVISLSDLQCQARTPENPRPNVVQTLLQLLHDREITALTVPSSFPLLPADQLRAGGITVTPENGPFFPERRIKRSDELTAITDVLRKTEAVLSKAIDRLRASTIIDNQLFSDGGELTSERLRSEIEVDLIRYGLEGHHTIVASGDQACDPHQIGYGPLKADSPIILDIFPRSQSNRYFADITRTVIKGSPSPKAMRNYQVVAEAVEIAEKKIAPGVPLREVHRAVASHFEISGFRTERVNGRMVGFFHSTGHGVGLDIHEEPRIADIDGVFEPGLVMTVEPGLYYPGIGGVRIEDMVLVTTTGSQVLTRAPKFLRVD